MNSIRQFAVSQYVIAACIGIGMLASDCERSSAGEPKAVPKSRLRPIPLKKAVEILKKKSPMSLLDYEYSRAIKVLVKESEPDTAKTVLLKFLADPKVIHMFENPHLYQPGNPYEPDTTLRALRALAESREPWVEAFLVDGLNKTVTFGHPVDQKTGKKKNLVANRARITALGWIAAPTDTTYLFLEYYREGYESRTADALARIGTPKAAKLLSHRIEGFKSTDAAYRVFWLMQRYRNNPEIADLIVAGYQRFGALRRNLLLKMLIMKEGCIGCPAETSLQLAKWSSVPAKDAGRIAGALDRLLKSPGKRPLKAKERKALVALRDMLQKKHEKGSGTKGIK